MLEKLGGEEEGVRGRGTEGRGGVGGRGRGQGREGLTKINMKHSPHSSTVSQFVTSTRVSRRKSQRPINC